MNRSLCLLLLWWPLAASALEVAIQPALFRQPAGGAYLELSLYVVGRTIHFDTIGADSLQARALVQIRLKRGSAFVLAEKFELTSPVVSQPASFIQQWRFALAEGTFALEVEVVDAADADNRASWSDTLHCRFGESRISQSDLQLLQAFRPAATAGPFVKNGYFMEPLPFAFYPKTARHLIFYNEIYGTDEVLDGPFVLSWRVLQVLPDGTARPVMIGHKKKEPAAVVPVLMQADIGKLPSGKYRLEVEVRNADKVLLSKKAVAFRRANPYLDLSLEALDTLSLQGAFAAQLDSATLRYSLKALAPLLDEYEGGRLNELLRQGTLEAQRRFLFYYWAQHHPNDPQGAYEAFMAVARAVDRRFRSGFGYGFETDRGYVFIKYGAPHDIVTVEDEPDAPPYEIWSYHYLPRTGQTNVKFLFYNPSLAAGDFRLLHSTVRGEVYNPRWEVELYRHSPEEIEGTNYLDGTTMQDKMGRRARRLMSDF